jgi:hypothetical protein
MLESLLLGLFSHPELLTEAEALFTSIAHGEGGVAKVEAATNNLAQVVTTGVAIVANAKAVQAAATAAQNGGTAAITA